jgi:hypothetical protein
MLKEETLKRLSLHGVTESQLTDALRNVFPHGHEDFLPTTIKELELHSVKNHDYASGGSALGNFNRVSAILALYPGLNPADRRVIALTYALKQLDAVLWGLAKKIAHKVEGLNERLGDISIYAKIVMCMNIEDARNKSIDQQFGVDLHPTPAGVGGSCEKSHTMPGTSAAGLLTRASSPVVGRQMCPELSETQSAKDRFYGDKPRQG